MKTINAEDFYDKLKKQDLEFMQQSDLMACIKDLLDRQEDVGQCGPDRLGLKYLVVRPEDVVEVLLLKNKDDGTWSFVNVTKGHVCPCRFKDIFEAEADMEKQVSEGKILRYEKVSGPAYMRAPSRKTFKVQGFELKACPHCGGEPDFEYKDDYSAHRFWRVACSECGCGTMCDDDGWGHADEPGKLLAVQEWNADYREGIS